MWVDSHAHLNDEAFSADWAEAINRANAAQVGKILVVGYDLPSSRRAVELAGRYDGVIKAAVGIHPHDAKTWNPHVAAELESLLDRPEVVALGEIGLDYHYNYSSKEDQLRAFRDQLGLAKSKQKPVIIHNREAHQDTMTLLDKEKVGQAGGVMHCFSGSYETAMHCIDLGLFISFAGPLTFPNAANLREVALRLPLDKILIETDSPYLSPHPFRGQRNEPARVSLVGEKLAEIRKAISEEVMAITSRNAEILFGFKEK